MHLSSRSLIPVIVLAALSCLPAAATAADQIAYQCDNDLCLVNPDSGLPTNITTTVAAQEQEPAWSPDGTKLAFRGALPPLGWEIYTLATANPTVVTNVSQTTDRTEAGPIQWSPGGERLAYTGIYDSNAPPNLGFDVFVSPAAGTAAPTPIGSTSALETYGRWSPDGSRIVFFRNPGGIFIGNADGSGTPSALPNGSGLQPSWSPDGTRIATTAGNAIRVVRADGTGSPVTFNNFASGSLVDGPYFSPDGTRVAWGVQNTVYVQAADGSGSATPINPPNGRPGGSISWSPDGTRLAFPGFDATSGIDIFVAKADGTGSPVSVTPSGSSNVNPTWKPDPNAQPPVTPPVDPPVVPTRPPVTDSLAKYQKLYITGGRIPFVPISYIICTYPTPAQLAAGCKFDADGTINGSGATAPGARVLAKKKIKFGSGSLDLAYGEEGELGLKVSKAGKRLLKPGKTLKIKVTINQRVGSDPVVTTTKTLKLKVPKKKGK